MKHETVVDAATEILACLSAGGPATQNDLTGINRLKRTAIFYVFDALQKAGLVVNDTQPPAQRGRPTKVWQLAPQAGAFLTVYLNTFRTYIRLCDFQGNVILDAQEPPCGSLSEATTAIESWLQRSPVGNLCGVMVGLSGLVDAEQGRVMQSRRWEMEDYPLVDKLAKRLPDCPLILIENNARLAAWGERICGACEECDHFLTLHLHGGKGQGTSRPLGLGSGMVLDGRLFRGYQGMAGELDTSFYRWLRRHHEPGATPPSSLAELPPEQVASFARSLGTTMSHLVNYLSPQRVVVVFDEEPCSATFCDAFDEQLLRNLMPGHAVPCTTGVATTGEQSVLNGGAAYLREHFFKVGPRLATYIDRQLSERKTA